MQSGKPCSTSYLVFGASLRQGSFNTRLASLAATVVEEAGGTVVHASMSDFDCPSYNGDVEVNEGIPAGADRFRSKLVSTDGLIISSPEYNASIPGVLKNVIDWVSRYKPQPIKGRHALLMSASPSMAGESVEAAKHYPVMKSQWIEFLGERPNPATERVEVTETQPV